MLLAEKKQKVREYKPARQCPKCGRRLAEHSNRLSCGYCGYAEFKHDKKV